MALANWPDCLGSIRYSTVTNTGPVAGAEVGQVYLGIPVEGQPPKRLVGFKKVYLEPGQSQRVSVVIDPAASFQTRGQTVVALSMQEKLSTIADDAECRRLMETFIKNQPQLWNEDIGV